jgi:hypothetical protein
MQHRHSDRTEDEWHTVVNCSYSKLDWTNHRLFKKWRGLTDGPNDDSCPHYWQYVTINVLITFRFLNLVVRAVDNLGYIHYNIHRPCNLRTDPTRIGNGNNSTLYCGSGLRGHNVSHYVTRIILFSYLTVRFTAATAHVELDIYIRGYRLLD